MRDVPHQLNPNGEHFREHMIQASGAERVGDIIASSPMASARDGNVRSR